MTLFNQQCKIFAFFHCLVKTLNKRELTVIYAAVIVILVIIIQLFCKFKSFQLACLTNNFVTKILKLAS